MLSSVDFSISPSTIAIINNLPFDELGEFLDGFLDHVMRNDNVDFAWKSLVHSAFLRYCTYYDKEGDGDSVKNGLYEKLEARFKQIVETTKLKLGEEPPEYYNTQWESYTTAAGELDRLFDHFNVNWIARPRAKGEQLYPIKTLAVVIWWKSFSDLNFNMSPTIEGYGVHDVVQKSEALASGEFVGDDAALKEYFGRRLELIAQTVKLKQGEELLKCYATQWESYTNAADCFGRLFDSQCEGKQVYPVKTYAVAQWRQHILLQPVVTVAPGVTVAPAFTVAQAFTVALMKLVAAKRGGTQIDLALVKKVLKSLVSLVASDPTREYLDVYREHFEALFL
ncbi:hypothetical protein B0H13DRAFT_1862318 [Mycena leptocephala]|nr:hypothetical protein B0H13DRAFT_1862318 [Mycena leptocephala]